MPFPAPVLALLRELSALPYENLSKMVAFQAGGGGDVRKAERALALSGDWLERARAGGCGGTCFALTWWLARRMREAGFPSAFLLADKGRGRGIHCGLRFAWEGRDFLLDPGYMIFDPLPLPSGGLAAAAWAPPNEVILEDVPAGPPPRGPAPAAPPSTGSDFRTGSTGPAPGASLRVAPPDLPQGILEVTQPGARAWRLWSGPSGAAKWRFDFRRADVPEGDFLRAWEASYAFPMMGYPVLNRVKDGTQHYLQKRSLLVRTPEASNMRKLTEEELREALAGVFGIPEGLAREALALVLRRDPDFFRK